MSSQKENKNNINKQEYTSFRKIYQTP